nr:nucleolar G-protein [Cryptomonas curvata]
MNTIFSANDIIDIILSKTQRKTPTIIHQHFSIQRVRQFYIKKIKFIQQKFDFYVKNMLKNFPIIDQLDPFYKDLLNILFNRNHYKIALSRLNNSRTIVSKISTNYIRLLKFGNSFYNCKHLKKVAIGRICTVIKKLNFTFLYLEKIRKQIKSIPSIDPYRKTILVCGSLNCGKSSLINKISKANVTVNSNVYTTKSLQIGHCSKDFVRWQIVDTPGLQSTKIIEYTSIEMQTINAVIHLEHTMLYIFDPSSKSKTTLFQQIDIFNSVLSLLKNKKKLCILGKTDLEWEINKNRTKKALLYYVFKIFFKNSEILKISCHDEIGFLFLHKKACELKDNKIQSQFKQVHKIVTRGNIENVDFYENKSLNKDTKLYENSKNINFKQKFNAMVILKKLSGINLDKNFSLLDMKTIETEEKIRELIYEEKYVFSNLKYFKIDHKFKDNLKITPKNSIVSKQFNYFNNKYKN